MGVGAPGETHVLAKMVMVHVVVAVRARPRCERDAERPVREETAHLDIYDWKLLDHSGIKENGLYRAA